MRDYGRRSRRARLLASIAVIAVALTGIGAAGAALWPGRDGGESCPAPAVDGLRALAATSDLVAEGDVTREVTLQDGAWTAAAWEMDGVRSLAGTRGPGAIVVWPSLDLTEIPTGHLLVFLNVHPRTQLDGADVPGHDVAGDAGVLLADGDSWRRICRSGLAPAIDRSVIDRAVSTAQPALGPTSR